MKAIFQLLITLTANQIMETRADPDSIFDFFTLAKPGVGSSAQELANAVGSVLSLSSLGTNGKDKVVVVQQNQLPVVQQPLQQLPIQQQPVGKLKSEQGKETSNVFTAEQIALIQALLEDQKQAKAVKEVLPQENHEAAQTIGGQEK